MLRWKPPGNGSWNKFSIYCQPRRQCLHLSQILAMPPSLPLRSATTIIFCLVPSLFYAQLPAGYRGKPFADSAYRSGPQSDPAPPELLQFHCISSRVDFVRDNMNGCATLL